MKKSYYYLIVTIVLGFESLSAGTIWLSSIKKGLELARESNRPLIVDLYADWCTYCKVLENDIFPSSLVAKELDKFVAVRINGEEFPNLMNKFDIRGYPTILFLDKNGNYIDKLTGLPTKDMVLQKIKDSYEKRDIEEILITRHKADPQGVLTNYKLGVYYYQTGDLKKAGEYFLNSYNSPGKESADKRHDSMYNICLINMDTENFSEAIVWWTKYMTTYPTGNGDHSSARYFRGIAYGKTGKAKEAKEDLIKAKELTSDPIERKNIQKEIDKL